MRRVALAFLAALVSAAPRAMGREQQPSLINVAVSKRNKNILVGSERGFEIVNEATGKKTFLAPAKVYRELYRAIVELRTKNTWPRSIQDLGLLGIFTVKRESQHSDARDAETAT